MIHSIFFESPDIGAIDLCLVNKVAALLRHFLLGQSYPIYSVLTMYWCKIKLASTVPHILYILQAFYQQLTSKRLGGKANFSS